MTSGITGVVIVILVAAVVVVRVAADRGTTHASLHSPVAAAPIAGVRLARTGTTSFQDPHPSAAAASAATPTRITIPSIGVDAGLQSLKTDVAGVLQPPTNFTDAGWFSSGVRPGNIGPAVIAGHFDAVVGPAVFDSLRLLRPGAQIDVPRSDGTTARFKVTRTALVSDALFPTAAVYGPTPDAQLRLITCGGTFNRSIGHYDDNLVVFATLI
ncbi:class F sortase [uncultured Amnibacterium sp.]|uniref:class F sortase n=1 Tax=uncultured Amnibacterium sp. TaxID=1631851 RepID=UPI0035C971BC